MTAYIALNEKQFRDLVAGKEVVETSVLPQTQVNLVVKIILSDIGFSRMRRAIDEAEIDTNPAVT